MLDRAKVRQKDLVIILFKELVFICVTVKLLVTRIRPMFNFSVSLHISIWSIPIEIGIISQSFTAECSGRAALWLWHMFIVADTYILIYKSLTLLSRKETNLSNLDKLRLPYAVNDWHFLSFVCLLPLYCQWSILKVVNNINGYWHVIIVAFWWEEINKCSVLD